MQVCMYVFSYRCYRILSLSNSVETQNNSCLKHNLTPLIIQFQSLLSYVCLHWLVTNKPQSASLKENASTQTDSENVLILMEHKQTWDIYRTLINSQLIQFSDLRDFPTFSYALKCLHKFLELRSVQSCHQWWTSLVQQYGGLEIVKQLYLTLVI